MAKYTSIMISLLCIYGFLSSIGIFKETSHAVSLSDANEYGHIRYMSRRLERALSQLARDEMGVMALQAAFDNIEYHTRSKHNSDTRLKNLAAKFSRRLMDYTNLVTGTRPSVTRLYETHKKSPLAPRFECCNLSERDLSLDLTYGCRVSRRKCCDLIPRSLPLTSFNPGHNLTKRFQKLLDYWPHVKWFYFITADGLHSEFPAHNFFHSNLVGLSDVLHGDRRSQNRQELPYPHSRAPVSSFYSHGPEAWQPQSLPNTYTCHALHNLRHRDTFVRSVVPAPIWLAIVVDQGQASQTQILLGHRVAQLLVASLSEKDRVAVLLVSDSIRSAFGHLGAGSSNASSPTSDDGVFQPAVSSSKSMLNSLLANVHRPLHVKTNHTLALVSAFEVIRNRLIEKRFPSTVNTEYSHHGPHLLLAYISRGYLNELDESARILQAVNDQQRLLPDNQRVIINAYMTVEEKSSTDPKERSFMTNLAGRWNVYSNKETQVGSNTVRPGHFFEINRTTDFSDTVGRFYELFSRPYMHNGNSSFHRVNDDMSDKTGINASTANPQPSPPDPINPPVQYSLPYHDLEGSGGLVVSISQAFYDGNRLIGVMGIDVHVADLFDNFIHFTDGAEAGGAGSSSAFVVHAPDGYALMHPAVASDPRLSLPLASDWLKTTLNARSRNGLDSIQDSLRPKDFGSSPTQSAWYSAPEPGISFKRQSTAHMKSTTGNPFPNFKPPLAGEFRGSALHLDISQLEVLPGFVEHVRTPLLTRASGSIVLPVHLSTRQLADAYGLTGTLDTCASNASGIQPFRVVYTWHRVLVPKTPFVVVLRHVETSCTEQTHLTPLVPEFEFHYHRLDLLKLSHTCLYLRQLATFDFGTIYLAPKAFSRPFARLRQTSTDTTEVLNDVRHLMAYLLDHTMLISNPGLNELTRPSIRSSVAVVERIGKFWAQRLRVGSLRHSIVRRYVATDTGVMLIYPGTLLPETFDPTVRTWYRRALAAPGHIVATGPYLDERGVGHIITLSRTIFEGNATGIHDPSRDKVSAVIAIDVSYLMIRRLLSVWLPECSPGQSAAAASAGKSSELNSPLSEGEDGVRPSEDDEDNKTSREESRQRCVLMDDRSYLMEHPRWSTMPEHNHLHYHEPIVAADLLKHHTVMEKKTCVHYPSRSIQRYYNLHTGDADLNHVIENVSPKMNQCVTYQHTNLYIGLISKHHRVGCTPRTAFCPCSAIGRRCFNCVRLEPKECECPCECPLSGGVGIPGWVDALRDVGVNTSAHQTNEYSPCPALIELESSHPIPLASLVASMASLTGERNALSVCSQPNSDYREMAPPALIPDPSPFPLTPELEFGGGVGERRVRPDPSQAGYLGHQEASGSTADPRHQCWELDRLTCATTDDQCRWCRLPAAGRLQENVSLEYRCLPTFFCALDIHDGQAVPSSDGQSKPTLNDWSLSSSFTWHSNIEQKPDRRPPKSASSPEYHQAEYTYRLVEWMSKRSRLIAPSSDGDSDPAAVGSHNGWWFGPGQTGVERQSGERAGSGSRVHIGPVAGALLALFTVLLLLLLVYLAHRHRRLGPTLVDADDNTALHMVLTTGLSQSGHNKMAPDSDGDDEGTGRPPARFPPSPPTDGGTAATDGSAMVPLLVLLDSSGASREANVTSASSPSTLHPAAVATTLGSDTSDSSVVGRSFKSVVSTTSSSSTASNSSKASSSGVTGSLSAFTMKSARRKHRIPGGRQTKPRPEFDVSQPTGSCCNHPSHHSSIPPVSLPVHPSLPQCLLESDGQVEPSGVTLVTDPANALVYNHVYRLPVVVRDTLRQPPPHCASEPESVVGSDCLSSTSSSAVSATLLAVRLKAAARVRRLMLVAGRKQQLQRPSLPAAQTDPSRARSQEDNQ